MKIYIYLFLFSLFLFPDIMYAQDEKIPETAIDKEKVNLMIFSGMIETYFLYYWEKLLSRLSGCEFLGAIGKRYAFKKRFSFSRTISKRYCDYEKR